MNSTLKIVGKACLIFGLLGLIAEFSRVVSPQLSLGSEPYTLYPILMIFTICSLFAWLISSRSRFRRDGKRPIGRWSSRSNKLADLSLSLLLTSIIALFVQAIRIPTGLAVAACLAIFATQEKKVRKKASRLLAWIPWKRRHTPKLSEGEREPTKHPNVAIGRVLDPVKGRAKGEAFLTERDLLSGIGIFGDGAVHTSKLIVAGAYEAGYDCVVLDFWNRYANIVNYVKGTRLLRLGKDFTVNPFSTEGSDHFDYAELFLEALAHVYRLSSRELVLIREFLLDAYEQSGKKALTTYRAEAALQTFLEEIKEERELMRSSRIIKGAFQPLFYGKTCKSLSGQRDIPIEKLFKDLTVVELGAYEDYDFRSFVQALLLVKYYAYLRSKGEETKAIVLLTGVENLIPNRLNFGYDVREPRFLYRLNELRQKGISFHLSSSFPYEVDRAAFDLIETTIVHRLSGSRNKELFANISTVDGNKIDLTNLKPGQALLKRASEEHPRLVVVDRPDWLLSELAVEQEVARAKTMLEEEFGGDSSKAYSLLKVLERHKRVHRDSMALLSGLPRTDVEDLLCQLQESYYVRLVRGPSEKPGIRHFFFQLSSKGKRALGEYEQLQGKLELEEG